MHYGSIIGMTQFYRPAAAMPKKEEEEKQRKILVSFAHENDTFYFDPSFPTQSLSCPDFNYDPTEESDTENMTETESSLDSDQEQDASPQ